MWEQEQGRDGAHLATETLDRVKEELEMWEKEVTVAEPDDDDDDDLGIYEDNGAGDDDDDIVAIDAAEKSPAVMLNNSVMQVRAAVFPHGRPLRFLLREPSALLLHR